MTAEDYLNVFGGDIDIYARILALTNRAALQAEFDRAQEEYEHLQLGSAGAKHPVGYMTVAAVRLEEVGGVDVA